MITIKGLEALKKQALNAEVKVEKAREVVKQHAGTLQRVMQRNATFKGHYRGGKFIPPTGETKRSISLKFEDGNLKAVVGPQTHYAAYLELGTRFMSAQPFVEKSLKVVEPSFIKNLEKIGGKK